MKVKSLQVHCKRETNRKILATPDVTCCASVLKSERGREPVHSISLQHGLQILELGATMHVLPSPTRNPSFYARPRNLSW
jgi:hypothetical protein